MGNCLVTNNAAGTLASGINDSAVTVVLTSGNGALFPNPLNGDFFYGTLVDASNNKEIVKVTGRSTDTLTVVRGQDNTTARAFLTGDRFELRDCAAVHATYPQLGGDNTYTGNQDITGAVAINGTETVAGDVVVKGAAATERKLQLNTDATLRWELVANSTAEGGANAGSDLELRAYADNGSTLVAKALSIARSTGIATVLAGFKVGSDKADHFASGVKMVFRQSAVPTGWTKDTTYNDAAFRCVSGTPSQQTTVGNEFSTLLAARTIAKANLPNYNLNVTDPGHVHQQSVVGGSGVNSGGSFQNTLRNNPGTNTFSAVTGITVNSGGSGTALNFDVNYVDLYIATKD